MTVLSPPAGLVERYGLTRILAIREDWLAFVASLGPRPDLDDAPRVATCPVCSAWWSNTTPQSWWRFYVCCYSCARRLAGVDRCLTAEELEAFLLPPAHHAATPTQLALFG